MPSDPSSSMVAPAALDPSRLDIEARQPALEEVLKRIRDGECDLGVGKPEQMQPRAGEWTTTEKSRLIESVLIRVPLPTFYVDGVDEERWVVIDGRRRLAAISEFVLEKSFVLTGLEYLAELEGQGYDDLARALKRRLGETQISVELIKPGTPTAIRSNLFHRINPGLSRQSVREAVMRGPATDLIDRLSRSDAYRVAIGAEQAINREAILRFLAFFPLAQPPRVEPPLGRILDRCLDALNEQTLDGMIRRHLLEQCFLRAMATLVGLFGDDASYAPLAGLEDGREEGARGADAGEADAGEVTAGEDGGDAELGEVEISEPEPDRAKAVSMAAGPMASGPFDLTMFNSALFETWSVSLARLDPAETRRLLARREEVIKAFTELLHDHGFAAATAPGIDDPDSVRTRFTAIHDLVGQFVSA